MYLSNFCLNSKWLGSHYSHSPLHLQKAPMTGKSIIFFFPANAAVQALSSGTKQQSNSSPTWPLLRRVPSCPVSYWPSFLFQPVFRLLFSHSFFLWFVISPVFCFFLGICSWLLSGIHIKFASLSFPKSFLFQSFIKNCTIMFLNCMVKFPLSLNFPWRSWSRIWKLL